MDPRLEEYLKAHCGPNCYGEQDENGVDLSLIRENLKLTPMVRLRRGERYSGLLLEMFPFETARLRCLLLSRELMKLVDAFSDAQRNGDFQMVALIRNAVHRMMPISTEGLSFEQLSVKASIQGLDAIRRERNHAEC